MSLENATKISELVPTNPAGTDPKSQGDDHLRMIKLVMQNNAIKSEIGQSATPANNFTLDASADNGTMKLARNSGQDIMTVDAAGAVNFPQSPFVKKSGDTMTGSLVINTDAAKKLVLRRASVGVGQSYIDFQDVNGSSTGYVGHGSNDNSMQFVSTGAVVMYSSGGYSFVDANTAQPRFQIGSDGSLTISNGAQMNLYPAGNNYEIINRAAGTLSLYAGGGTVRGTLDGAGLWATPAAVGYTASAANMYMFPGGEMTMGSTSARKFKTNIRQLEYGLAEILKIDTVRYNSLCKGDNIADEYIGLVADDVQGFIPELVVLDGEGAVAGFDYAKLSVILINAVKELTARISELENK